MAKIIMIYCDCFAYINISLVILLGSITMNCLSASHISSETIDLAILMCVLGHEKSNPKSILGSKQKTFIIFKIPKN